MTDWEALEAELATKVAPCVAVTLCVRHEDDPREGFVRCFEDYCARFGEHLSWFVEDDTGRFKKFGEKGLGYPRTRLMGLRGRLDGEDDVIWAATGGAHYRDASPWQWFAAVSGGLPPSLHYLRATCHRGAFEDRWPEFVSMVRRWANWLRVWHGNAGYSLNLTVDDDDARRTFAPVLCAVARRFRGVELDYWTSIVTSTKDGIKGVNWLTLVSNELLRLIGSADEIRSKLSPEVALETIQDGLLFQAGAHPEIGDVNRGERLPLYGEVARLLEPVRARNVWPIYFDTAETRRWLDRFDD